MAVGVGRLSERGSWPTITPKYPAMGVVAGSFNVRQPTTRPPFGSNCLQVNHLLQMLGGDAAVAGFPKQNARWLGINSSSRALHPRAVPIRGLASRLPIARRADIHDAGLVAGAHVHGLRRDVHPADVISVRAANQFRVVIMHPVGIRLTEARPVVRRALRIAGEPDKFVVDQTPPVPAPPLNSAFGNRS